MNWKERQTIVNQALSQTSEGTDRHHDLSLLQQAVENIVEIGSPNRWTTHTGKILRGDDNEEERLVRMYKRLLPESEL